MKLDKFSNYESNAKCIYANLNFFDGGKKV